VCGYRRADESFDSGTHDAAADQSDRSETNVGERPATHHPADLITRFEVLATIIRPIGIRLVVASRRTLPLMSSNLSGLAPLGNDPTGVGPPRLAARITPSIQPVRPIGQIRLVRAAFRYGLTPPVGRSNLIGFRVVVSPFSSDL
jgi:hypothetical protein